MAMIEDCLLPSDLVRQRNLRLLKLMAPYVAALTFIAIGLSISYLDPNRHQPQAERGPELLFVGLSLIAIGILIALPDQKKK